jgi:hypothetical protein
MKYKISNKLESPIKLNGIMFNPKETKILELDIKPDSDKLEVEELDEKKEKKKQTKREEIKSE